MKYLITILIIVLLSSCTKQRICYDCQVGYTHQEYCGDIKDFHPKDPQGNDVNYFCTPK